MILCWINEQIWHFCTCMHYQHSNLSISDHQNRTSVMPKGRGPHFACHEVTICDYPSDSLLPRLASFVHGLYAQHHGDVTSRIMSLCSSWNNFCEGGDVSHRWSLYLIKGIYKVYPFSVCTCQQSCADNASWSSKVRSENASLNGSSQVWSPTP